MKPIQIIANDVFDKIRSRFENLEMGDETGAVTIDPAMARFFDFDFIYENVNLGRISISLNDLGSLKLYYSQGITENQDDPAKKLWYSFLKEMRLFAMRRLLRFDTRDIAKTNLDKNDFQQLAATQAQKDEDNMNTMNETKKIKKSVAENTGRDMTNTPRDRLISRMSPSVDNNALLQKVGKVVNSPEFNSDTILKIVDSPNITHPVGLYIQKEFDELQYDLGRAYEDRPEEVAEKLLSMLKGRTQQGLAEGRWNEKSSKKTSRAVKGRTEVIVRHNNPVDEMYPGSRSQRKNIKAIYIQNSDGERFKYPFIHPAGAFAMAQHVDHGGAPHDPAGKAIVRMSEQIAQLQEFQRQVQRSTLHDDAMGITERAVGKLQELKGQIESLSKRHHYEAWSASFVEQDEQLMADLDPVTMETYKAKFTETNFKEDLASFFPLLHSIMQEANTIDLEDYVKESTCPKCDCDPCECEGEQEVKENAFARFEEWAEATEQGKLTDDQIEELKVALAELPNGEMELGHEGQTAWQFFSGLGLDDNDLEEKLKAAAEVDLETDPIEVLQVWARDNYPELLVALGMSGTSEPEEPEAPAPEQPVAEGSAHGYNVAKWYAKNGDQLKLTKWLRKEAGLPNDTDVYFDDADLVYGDKTIVPNALVNTKLTFNDLLTAVAQATGGQGKQNMGGVYREADIAEGKEGSMVQEVAKIVKSFYNRDNPEVGPFRGGEGIAIDVEKSIGEKFGESAGQQARALAEKFMEKLTMEWQERHSAQSAPVDNSGLARLKELVGNIKSKVESVGEKNPQHSHQYDTTMKHADNPSVQQRMAAHDIKPGVAGYRDRIDMLKDLERTGKLKKEDIAAFEDIMRLANYKK